MTVCIRYNCISRIDRTLPIFLQAPTWQILIQEIILVYRVSHLKRSVWESMKLQVLKGFLLRNHVIDFHNKKNGIYTLKKTCTKLRNRNVKRQMTFKFSVIIVRNWFYLFCTTWRGFYFPGQVFF